SEELLQKWSKVLDILKELPTVMIPRHIGFIEICKCQLLVFVDASIRAYAAVVYLRIETGSTTTVNLIFAKTRLAPGKNRITLPRLEQLTS
ncbi:MAG: hypothetical protein GY696_17095, partial [Gammaproteobacteria bacterium]|nr:hypothetical protein [Gammaproteobacteria bacterium]